MKMIIGKKWQKVKEYQENNKNIIKVKKKEYYENQKEEIKEKPEEKVVCVWMSSMKRRFVKA